MGLALSALNVLTGSWNTGSHAVWGLGRNTAGFPHSAQFMAWILKNPRSSCGVWRLEHRSHGVWLEPETLMLVAPAWAYSHSCSHSNDHHSCSSTLIVSFSTLHQSSIISVLAPESSHHLGIGKEPRSYTKHPGIGKPGSSYQPAPTRELGNGW